MVFSSSYILKINTHTSMIGVSLELIKNGVNGQPATGARLSTTRYLLYGRISVKMTAIPVPGAVSTFITMSQRKDEIDWEFVGANVTEGQSNVFYKGIEEFNIHNFRHLIPNGADFATSMHVYTIDWRSDSLTWLIDGVPVRTLSKENATSPMVRIKNSYDLTSKIEFNHVK